MEEEPGRREKRTYLKGVKGNFPELRVVLLDQLRKKVRIKTGGGRDKALEINQTGGSDGGDLTYQK